MKDFYEFYEDKEHEQPLEEEVFTSIITGMIGVPLALALAWSASWVTKKYIGFTRKLFLGIVNNIKAVGDVFRKDKKEAKEKVEKTINTIEKKPEVKKASREVEKIHDKYSKELDTIYSAIDDKEIEKARKIFFDMPENKRENPEVKLAITQHILEVYEEPPIYVVSPGNDTFQAIKKILGQKIARAMEELGKRGFSKYYENVEDNDE